jgi:hypothetical protein
MLYTVLCSVVQCISIEYSTLQYNTVSVAEMWLLGVLLCLSFNLTSAKIGVKCTTIEAKDFIESSSGRKVAYLQQFPQDGTCRVKFSDSSRYYVCNYVCM